MNLDHNREESTSTAGEYQAWLLVELRRRLHQLPAEAVEETIREVREHLTCSQAALIELGEDPATSDFEAVRRFGDVKKFALDVIRSGRSKPIVCPWIPWVALATILYVLGMAIFTIYDKPALWCVPGIAIPIFITLSWRAKDSQWRGLAKSGLLAMGIVSAMLGFTWVDLRGSGGIGEVPRWTVSHYRQNVQKALAAYPQMLAACDRAEALYASGRAAVERSELFSDGMFVAYHAEHIPDRMMPMYLPRKVDSFEAAALTWEEYRRYERPGLESFHDFESRNAVALQSSPATAFHWRIAGEGAAAAGFLCFVAVAVNCMVVVVRGMYDRLRGRPRRLIA